MVDALAYPGDEGRVKLRKAAGSCTRAQIRRYPNGATHPALAGYSFRGRPTRGTETSKYPEEQRTIE